MMVTFVSQCEHKALNRTRRVLDAFANRIGTNTWQTVITDEGLQAVKKLLRKTATKNTAVSCHWIRSRSRSDLVWLVGNRDKFNAEGFVPVNWTKKNILNRQWENDWDYLPLIKGLTALAALFHDWGKASDCFQDKLKPNSKNKYKGDPIRHEWVSVLLLSAFVNQQTDEQWLVRLAQGEFDEAELLKQLIKPAKNPLKGLPPIASLICWLIVSHHRLPLPKDNQKVDLQGREAPPRFQDLLGVINSQFGYENLWQEGQQERVDSCLNFQLGLPCQSDSWLKNSKKWAVKLNAQADKVPVLIENGSWRLIIHYARTALMLGDHNYSSQPIVEKWETAYLPIANTYFEDVTIGQQLIKQGTPKQKLDQHLCGVMDAALVVAQLLPAFEKELKPAFDIKALKKKTADKKYQWQDKAATKIRVWHKEIEQETSQYGFFTVNMASTGCGKTFANAKMMQALSKDGASLRYILALGLRTLTLQTGDEYRERIGLSNDELAVLIGSRAVMELHAQKQVDAQAQLSDSDSGSESQEFLLDDNVIDYDSPIPEDKLSTLLTTERSKQFLYAPVLACTIDHIMAATETKRGGRYILPCLRLMSSDLVIDEIDDFTGHDLIAIGRLIHLAGMLGRKVMISSATIPPDLAKGYFNAYQQGWLLFAQARKLKPLIGCAWVDEFNTQVNTITNNERTAYEIAHTQFIKKRIKALEQQPAQRKATIISCDIDKSAGNIREQYFTCLQQAIIEKHQQHFSIDEKTQKHVSFGVVRMANIAPCVALTQYLAQADWGEGIDIRVMAYHSQQILLLRSAQEAHLDQVLKRNKKTGGLGHAIVQKHLQHSEAKQLIFIVVATPVEEVGRDHDFDWAVIEPSSFRSIIQLAGRVLRHRPHLPEAPNIAIMQYNLKALLSDNDTPVYTRPGYEDRKHLFESHDVNDLLSDSIQNAINAIPRIEHNPELNNPFADLEHRCIAELLTAYEHKKAGALQGWLTECWWLTALPQDLTPFRSGQKQRLLYLMPDKECWIFKEKDEKGKITGDIESLYKIQTIELTALHQSRLWLPRDYGVLLESVAEKQGIAIALAASRYGEISCRESHLKSDEGMSYCDDLGIVKYQ